MYFDEELMKFAMGNCIIIEDTNGNRKLSKKRYDQKIDAVAAMMDAYVAYKLNIDAFEWFIMFHASLKELRIIMFWRER